jgi:GTPase SAR1 family protein
MKVNDKVIKLQIWDTAGQERFRTIVNTYYKSTLLITQDSNAVFMIFDLGVK